MFLQNIGNNGKDIAGQDALQIIKNNSNVCNSSICPVSKVMPKNSFHQVL